MIHIYVWFFKKSHLIWALKEEGFTGNVEELEEPEAVGTAWAKAQSQEGTGQGQEIVNHCIATVLEGCLEISLEK
jgi:hypothetical protein